MSPDIIYVGSFYFPDKEAGAYRVLGIGKAMREAGFSSLFLGTERRGRTEDLQPDGRFVYQDFPYVSERNLGNTRFSRCKRAWLTHFSGNTTMERLRSLDLTRTHAIIAYNAFAGLLWRLGRFCRKKRIALIADCSEWYDPRQRIGGRFSPLRWDTELRMRWLHRKIGRVIVISSFLERYYRERGCSVIRVPPLIDMGTPKCNQTAIPAPEGNLLRLVYAGVPGKKDLLGNAIRALRDLRADDLRITLNLVGPSKRDVQRCLGRDAAILDELDGLVVCHGRVAHKEAVSSVAKADFSILLRPDKRYAHAGFPTKLVESLATGVPIIANVTSDIAEYVRDGVEGVLLDDSTPDAFAAGIKKVLNMPRERWKAMRLNARQRAAECFDYRQHVQPLKNFMAEAIRFGSER